VCRLIRAVDGRSDVAPKWGAIEGNACVMAPSPAARRAEDSTEHPPGASMT